MASENLLSMLKTFTHLKCKKWKTTPALLEFQLQKGSTNRNQTTFIKIWEREGGWEKKREKLKMA